MCAHLIRLTHAPLFKAGTMTSLTPAGIFAMLSIAQDFTHFCISAVPETICTNYNADNYIYDYIYSTNYG